MNLSTSRLLSLVVVAVAYMRAWGLDDLTYGAWYRGYQVDSHTPSLAIAVMGWFFLVLFVSALFFAHLPHK